MDTAPVTRLLDDWRSGNRSALDALTPIVYAELRKLAASYMVRERLDHTLQPTALIHEAYIRLIDQNGAEFESRSHFFGVAAHLMRQVLTDFARRRLAAKRGSGKKEELGETAAITEQQSEELLAVHFALDQLAIQDGRKAKAIELRYFGGLQREEIAEVLGVSLATVKRDLMLGEAWMRRQLGRPVSDALPNQAGERAAEGAGNRGRHSQGGAEIDDGAVSGESA